MSDNFLGEKEKISHVFWGGQNLASFQRVNIKLCAVQCPLLFVLIRDGSITFWLQQAQDGGDIGIKDILAKTMFKFTGNISGMVPEPADERQAAEDDLALWRPHACCLCPPGVIFLLAVMPSKIQDLENGPKWKPLMSLSIHFMSAFCLDILIS